MWHHHGRGFGPGYFPIPLIFMLFFIFHSLPGFFFSLLLVVVVGLLIRALTSASFSRPGVSYRNTNRQSYQPYKPSNSDNTPYYQPYQQGYTEQQREPEVYRPSSEQYDHYEQPQAQYPQEMPPMQER